MPTFKFIAFSLLLMASFPIAADRIKDFTDVAGVRSNKLIGYGLVVGLQATGDEGPPNYCPSVKDDFVRTRCER